MELYSFYRKESNRAARTSLTGGGKLAVNWREKGRNYWQD